MAVIARDGGLYIYEKKSTKEENGERRGGGLRN
jgi:hypothetical protein